MKLLYERNKKKETAQEKRKCQDVYIYMDFTVY